MGIHGIFKEIGPGERIALAKVASDHFVAHQRPLRLAVDIAIWLFQIQSGKGGSNPALRTFYYRLLRLLSLNIHPLFVFDGPNKPLFKRNKRVGGPGVRVASVPEFLAKQLLKQFGFPWHVAPGEAEAECALLQREGIVDAVLSEDVDTLMFGSRVTVRNWTPENSTKTPTHVNLYRAEKTMETSGLDREGMILVALMSGGDYIVEGIPGCGPKVACGAARAGFGNDLCAVAKKRDVAALKLWRERLQHEIRTNESKYFSRKSSKLTIPDDFPNREVLGYYTDPCVSTSDALVRLREDLTWDQDIEFPALRSFVAEAFDWRCLGGAKKFIRNLAPAMLVRRLRCAGDDAERIGDVSTQKQLELGLVQNIHGKRNHITTDGELEYRISFIPANLVPIDLSIEDPDDDYIPAGGAEEQGEIDDEWVAAPSNTQNSDGSASPTKKRNFRPYDPSQPEKLWMMRTFLIAGCPLMVETFETPPANAREFLAAKHKAKGKSKSTASSKTTGRSKQQTSMPRNALMAYTTVTKTASVESSERARPGRMPLQTLSTAANANGSQNIADPFDLSPRKASSAVVPPSTQVQQASLERQDGRLTKGTVPQEAPSQCDETVSKATKRHNTMTTPRRRKRPSPELLSPPGTQRTIDSYWSPASRRSPAAEPVVIDLISSPLTALPERPSTPSPKNHSNGTAAGSEDINDAEDTDWIPLELPDTVTKRRRRNRLTRHHSAPTQAANHDEVSLLTCLSRPTAPEVVDLSKDDISDCAGPASAQSSPASPSPLASVNQENTHFRNAHHIEEATTTSTHSESFKLLEYGNEKSFQTGVREVATDIVQTPRRRSPRLQQVKRYIQLRESLPGAWREIEIDATSDSPGTQQSSGKTQTVRWRASAVEVLDLTGI